ncbi:universal stress protein [Roseateles violae]|uniref:Universal stress protein n=1 Tax=Roseateles violae TaxID=3058042 RepID=A0ABT8DY68_9BURK|nr:universal stress protein [Pelomonas sp. PFR6]MDN3922217.1 universal stress protein [Pelomonas sp. PFR6]
MQAMQVKSGFALERPAGLPADTAPQAAYRHILVPCDGSASSLLGLDEAVRLARQIGAKVRVVHVIDELLGATGFEPAAVYSRDVLVGLRNLGADLLEAARARAAAAGATVETRLIESGGHAIVDRIIEQARDWAADLIVIGSHGRRGAARLFMGSDAEHILRLSPVPVLIVRRPRPESFATLDANRMS